MGAPTRGVARWQAIVFLVLVEAALLQQAQAFPPYKTTDADTADPYNLELRVGLVQAERASGTTEWASPLLRTNFGLPNKVELISEFEYRPEQHEFGDGAVGIKWAGAQGSPLSFGIETLALLPVRPKDSGVGVESQILATWFRPDHGFRVHINAGGFHDPRGRDTENGWRASVLTELMGNDSFRPGFELFAKKKEGHEADVRFGVGVIKEIGRLEIRSGVYVGLTDQAPDVLVNVWLSTKIPFR
jgi:hypothetical protein